MMMYNGHLSIDHKNRRKQMGYQDIHNFLGFI